MEEKNINAIQCNSEEQAGVIESKDTCTMENCVPSNWDDDYELYYNEEEKPSKSRKVMIITGISLAVVAVVSVILWLGSSITKSKMQKARLDFIKKYNLVKNSGFADKVQNNAGRFVNKVQDGASTAFGKVKEMDLSGKIKNSSIASRLRDWLND